MKNKTKNKAILTGKITEPLVFQTDQGLFNLVPLNQSVSNKLRANEGKGMVTLHGSFLRRKIEKDDQIEYRGEIQVSNVGDAFNGIHSIELCGFLGCDPHVAYPPTDGDPEVTLSVATNDSRPDPQKRGNWKQETTWHKVICKGETAVLVAEDLRKSSFVRVEGLLSQRRSRRGIVFEVLANSVNGTVLKTDPQHEEKFQQMVAGLREDQSRTSLFDDTPIVIIDLN